MTQLIELYQMVVVHPTVKANTLKEFVALAKTQPLNYGSYGSGSQPNLLYEALKLDTGIKWTHIPYKGIAPAIQATLANEVQATLGGAATTGQYFKAGKGYERVGSTPAEFARMIAEDHRQKGRVIKSMNIKPD